MKAEGERVWSQIGLRIQTVRAVVLSAKRSPLSLYSFCSGVSGAPSDNNIMLWNAVIFGPHETPFEDGTFKLTIVFTEDYPNKPPSVRLVEKRPQNRARICKLCKEPRNRFPAWQAGTTTLFDVPANQAT
jgi:hypothetical protein